MFTRYGKSWCPYRYRCPETRGGSYRMRVFSGPYNTVEEDVDAYNTICVRWLQSTVLCRVWSLPPWYSDFDL